MYGLIKILMLYKKEKGFHTIASKLNNEIVNKKLR